MTQTELKNYFRSMLVAQRTIAQEFSVLDAIVDFITQAITAGIPDWTNALTFNTDGSGAGSFCTEPDTDGKIRFWKTKTSGNIGNTPPINPVVTENTHWIEVSPSDGSAIKEWSAGVYGSGLVIVYHNHTTDGRGMYILLEATRPFNSTNIETEITGGKWALLFDAKQNRSEKGQANGYASLDGSGKVPSAQLPGYVDDVLEYANSGAFPGTGETGKIYIALDTNMTYRWSGSVYVILSSSPADASETVKGIAELLNQTEAEAVASAGTSAGADHTRVSSGRGLWWFWAKIKTIAQTFTAALTATDFTATNQTGSGYRVVIVDSSGKFIRNANLEYNPTTGVLTSTGLDDLDATYQVVLLNASLQAIAKFSNGRFLEIGGDESIYDIGTTVASGNARVIMNDNLAMGWIIEARDTKEYISFRTIDGDERVNIRQKLRLDTAGSNQHPKDFYQFPPAVANTTVSSVTLIGSIPMPTDEEVVFFKIRFRAVSNAGAGGWQQIRGAVQRISGGTVQAFGTAVSDAIQRTAGTFTFSADPDNTNKRINLNFTQNSSGGIAYKLFADAEWERVTEPA